MMIGTLKIFVLYGLSHEEMSGYDLIKEVESATGKRPSSGAIYPLLEDLKKRGIVKSRVSGRRKLYSLTAKGKKFLDNYSKQREALIKKIENMHNALLLVGEKNRCRQMFKNFRERPLIFAQVNSHISKIMHAVAFKMMQCKSSNKIGKIKKILDKAAMEIRKV